MSTKRTFTKEELKSLILSDEDYQKAKEKHHTTKLYPIERAKHDYASDCLFLLKRKEEGKLNAIQEVELYEWQEQLNELLTKQLTPEEIDKYNY